MKHFVLVLSMAISTVCFYACSSAEAYEESPDAKALEELSKSIVAALAADNYEAYKNLLISQREMVVLFQGATDVRTRNMANDSIHQMNRLQEKAVESYNRTREGGMRTGLKWEQAKYKSCSLEADSSKGIEITKLRIVVDCNGTEHLLTLNGVVRTTGGWKIFGRISYGDPEDLARMMMDSIRAADSIYAVQKRKELGK